MTLDELVHQNDLEARVRNEKICLKLVPLGREFVFKGQAYQMTKSLCTIAQVGVKKRFLWGDTWYVRFGASLDCRRLELNMPLGDESRAKPRLFNTVEKVWLLELTHRGTA